MTGGRGGIPEIPGRWLDLIRFGLVGVVNTGLDLAVFLMLHTQAGVSLPLANTAGFAVGVTNSYFLNGLWTFRGAGPSSGFTPSWRQAALFVLANGGGLGISTVVLMATSLVLPVLAAKGLAILAGFFWNYTVSRRLFVGCET